MKILIVEDDKAAVEAIKDAMSYTEGMQVVGTTDSATQGLKLVEAVNPHAIILDLELNEGDGLNFLKNLSTLMLNYKPFVLVTTNTTSKTVHDIVRNNGGDFIYTKNTLNYNPPCPDQHPAIGGRLSGSRAAQRRFALGLAHRAAESDCEAPC